MKLRIGAVLTAVALFCLSLAGCAGSTSSDGSTPSTTTTTTPAAKTALNVYTIQGPTGVGMVDLMKQNDDGKAANDYDFQVVSSPDQIVAKLTSGEADIAAVPTNLAATLYQKTSGGVQLLALNTKGVLYMLENGDTVNSVTDLRGKTIYTTGQGANPEYILRYVLEKNGIDPDTDVTIKFLTENTELATALISGEAEVALVPEPVVSTVQSKKASVRNALNITTEWEKITDGSPLYMGCVVARKAFATEHPDAVAAFLSEYETSIQAVTGDVSAAAALCETYGIIASAAVAEKAIPNCQLTFVAGKDMQAALEGYYNVLLEANAASIGGALPDDAFYYTAP